MRFILLFMATLWAAAVQAGTILVVGDSLSAGYGLRQGENWPSLLATRLKREGFDYSVVNASISGDTTAGGRRRIGAALAQSRPSIVIIALGANDGLRGLPIGAMSENLTAMANASRKANAKVVIAGMKLPPNFGPQYTGEFERSFAEVARTTKSAFLPFLLEGFAERREMFQSDNVHPVAAAEPMILENVWPVLAPLLKR